MDNDVEEGDEFTLGFRVIGHVNAAEISYWVEEVPVFVAPFDAFPDDTPRLMVHPDYIEEEGERDVEYARSYIDGLRIDNERRIEYLEEV